MDNDFFPLLCIGFLFLLFFYKLFIEEPSTIQKRSDNSQPKTNTNTTRVRKSEEEEYSDDNDDSEEDEEFANNERLFGKFMCSKCKKLWQSAHAYINTTQACKKCNVCVYPYELQKLEKVEGNENKIDKEKHHIQELCGKCAELGYNCSLRYTRNDFEYSKPSNGFVMPPFRPHGRVRYSSY